MKTRLFDLAQICLYLSETFSYQVFLQNYVDRLKFNNIYSKVTMLLILLVPVVIGLIPAICSCLTSVTTFSQYLKLTWFSLVSKQDDVNIGVSARSWNISCDHWDLVWTESSWNITHRAQEICWRWYNLDKNFVSWRDILSGQTGKHLKKHQSFQILPHTTFLVSARRYSVFPHGFTPCFTRIRVQYL
jgi:hypothetical protein